MIGATGVGVDVESGVITGVDDVPFRYGSGCSAVSIACCVGVRLPPPPPVLATGETYVIPPTGAMMIDGVVSVCSVDVEVLFDTSVEITR